MVHPGRWLLVAGAVVSLALFQGCSSSSPRFGAGREAERGGEERPERDAAPAVVPQREYDEEIPPGMDRDRLLLDVVSYLGAPYLHGGRSRKGLDCSAFTMQVYASALSITLPRSTKDQFRQGREVELNELAFGDLVFFNTTGDRPSHVGIYIEDGLFAHASSSEGVTFSSLESSYYKQRFIGARRVVR